MSGHTCHWPSCPQEVEPKRWGCKAHWYRLPENLRAAIWRTYRPGQEIDKKPSEYYLRIAELVQVWIEYFEPLEPSMTLGASMDMLIKNALEHLNDEMVQVGAA